MNSVEALKLLLSSHFGDGRAKRKVDKYYDEIENQLLTDLDRLEKLEKENQELKEQVNHLNKVIEVMQKPSKLDCTHMFDNCKELKPLPKMSEDKITRIEEALEIIRTKNVDTDLIKKCYGELAYALYNSCMKYRSDKLTKEEFDLVKEWLEE